jgi:hypothetical protein
MLKADEMGHGQRNAACALFVWGEVLIWLKGETGLSG